MIETNTTGSSAWMGKTSTLETYKSIRKETPPPTKVIRPKKGGGYRRPKNGKVED